MGGETYYELTISNTYGSAQKTDRLIVFTKLNIPDHYSVHMEFVRSKIEIVGHLMEIMIVVAFFVSIRPCELNGFNHFLGYTTNVSTSHAEYRSLMSYLTETGINLTDFLTMPDVKFRELKDHICHGARSTPIFQGLQKCREYRGKPGINVLTYLLYRLNNSVLQDQYYSEKNNELSGLYLKYGCIPFEVMPFSNNLPNHSTLLCDLLDCIDSSGREHEFLGRFIKYNTEINAKLYTPISELGRFKEIGIL